MKVELEVDDRVWADFSVVVEESKNRCEQEHGKECPFLHTLESEIQFALAAHVFKSKFYEALRYARDNNIPFPQTPPDVL